MVAGFKPVMPTYRGVLEEPEVAALVELIASIRDRPDRAERRAAQRRPASSQPTGLRAPEENR